MMMPSKLRLLGVAALSIASGNVLAQERLMDVYQRALQNDPVLREAEANYQVTLETRPQARSLLLPSLQFQAQTSASSREDPRRPTDFVTGQPNVFITSTETRADADSWSVNLNQTIFNWSRIVTLRQADKRVAQAEIDYERQRQDLLIRVAQAYFNVLAAQDTLAAQVAARESFARQLEQAQRRFEVGLIAITDVQESQAFFDTAVADEISAQRQVASSQEALREIIGTYVADLAGPTDELPLQPPQPADPEQWVEIALAQNLALVSSRIAAEVIEDDIAIERAARLPTLSFSTGWSDQSQEVLRTLNLDPNPAPPPPGQFAPTQPPRTFTESRGYNWSLNLNVPIYTGGLNRSRIQQSVYRHRAATEALEQVARQTEREARDAYLGVVSDIARVRALQQAVQSSRIALQAQEAGFEVGTRTTVDIVISQNNLSQAETNYARSRYDYILNVLRLKQATGGLGVEDIEEVDAWLQ